MPPPSAIFLSDAHLGAEPKAAEADREARLLAFLAALPGRADALYVVGDLFDFWFEYATALPRRHFRLLKALDDLQGSGVHVTLLTGNHDFWLGRFLHDELGIETHDGPLTVERDGRRIWLHHGDGLIGGDLGYKVLKKVLRNPASIAAYGWLHPDLGIPLARVVSRWSRGSRERRPLDGERLYREIALPQFADGYDAVMVGHFHHVYERRDGDRCFFVLGDWMEHFTYVELEAGSFRLLREGEGREARARSAG